MKRKQTKGGLSPIKVFLDGADLNQMRAMTAVAGFTTNPTLMRVAGVEHYRAFATKALEIARSRPVSFEVTADDFDEMAAQAHAIAALAPEGSRPFIKIPVTNTKGESSADLIRELGRDGVALNVTAVFTKDQVKTVGAALRRGGGPAVVSVFAGRVADAGVDPLEHMTECRTILHDACPAAEMLWASPRQAYDYVLARKAGCDIITMTGSFIDKLDVIGKDLEEFSLETVKMFYDDAVAAGYVL